MNTKFVHKPNKYQAKEGLLRKIFNMLVGGLLFALIKTYFFIPVLIDSLFNIVRKVKAGSHTTAQEKSKELEFGNLEYSNKAVQ